MSAGNLVIKYTRERILKKHKHFCYESQVQSMPGAKMGGSFVSPHGGYVGGWRKIHMIKNTQVKRYFIAELFHS